MNDGLQAASPGPVAACPSSSPSQGIMAVPIQNFSVGDIMNLSLVEGGPSICRDGDPSPLLVSVSDACPFQAAASHSQSKAALRVSDEIPSSEMPAVKSVSSGLVAELGCSEPPKTRPLRSYADVVSNVKGTDAECKSKTSSAVPRVKFAEAKTSLNKSFHDDGGTTFGHILEIDGRKVVTFSVEELDELAAPFEFTLDGKFSHGFPTMKTLKSIMGNLNLKGRYSVSLLEHKHVLFRFSCEEDYTRFWSRQVWHMAGFPMRVLKWTPDFDPLVEAPFAAVWVKFPYLPIHLFDKRSLFQIAYALGKPLRIDSSTAELTRASTPRVCIEIDLSKAPLPEVEIRLAGKIRIQEVEYENIPSYCSICKRIGHEFKDCKSSKKPEVPDSAVQHPNCPGRPPSPASRLPLDFDENPVFRPSGQPRFRKLRLTLEPEIVQKMRDDIVQSYEILPSNKKKKLGKNLKMAPVIQITRKKVSRILIRHERQRKKTSSLKKVPRLMIEHLVHKKKSLAQPNRLKVTLRSSTKIKRKKAR